MRLLLLGTAAAEGWPAPFCRCEACTEARALGGPDIRSRSGALIDDDLKIDFGPDTISQLQRTGRDLSLLRTLLFTHQHPDHIVPSELGHAVPPSTQTPPPQPITVFGNVQVLAMIRAQFPDPAAKNLDLRLLEPFMAVTTPTGDEVLPLPARHVQGALLLRVTRDGRSLLYGHDSDLFPDETIAALAGTPLHAALFDCTYGVLSPEKSRQAKAVQKDAPGDLSNLLVELGYISEKDEMRAHAQELGLQFVDLTAPQWRTIDPEAIQAVPEHLVKRYTILPIRKDGNKLMVAICQVKTSATGLDDIYRTSRCQITPVLATRSDIEEAMGRAYGSPATIGGGHMNMDGVLETIERLRAVGAVTPETRLVATHFSHNGGLLHDQLVAAFATHGVQVAYDGLAFDV